MWKWINSFLFHFPSCRVASILCCNDFSSHVLDPEIPWRKWWIKRIRFDCCRLIENNRKNTEEMWWKWVMWSHMHRAAARVRKWDTCHEDDGGTRSLAIQIYWTALNLWQSVAMEFSFVYRRNRQTSHGHKYTAIFRHLFGLVRPTDASR